MNRYSTAKGPDEVVSAEGQSVPVSASIYREAEHMRNEIERLRAAMRDETNGRRRHKRIPGNGATALLATPGHVPASVSIHDLARGGVAVTCDWNLPTGADVTVVLPGAQGVVPGHVVRSDGEMLAVMFEQDAESLAQLDRVLAWFEDTCRGGQTETITSPAADGASPGNMDAAVDAPPGATPFSTPTTSRILTDSKAVPFAEVRDGRLAFANPAFLSMFRADKDITGMSLRDLLALESQEAMDKLLADPEDTLVSFQGRAIRLDGALFDVEFLFVLETLNGVSTICVFAKDGTRHRNAERHLSYLAYTDVLTGLPNRALLMDRLRDAVVKARNETSSLVVMMADLDGFKAINDTFGHQTGDIVLQSVAQRFLKCVRDTDTLARLGGDEFCVLLPTIKDVLAAEMVATRFVTAARQPFALNGHDLSVGVSVGIALFPDHGSTGDAVLAAADAALYEAKRGGRDKFAVASALFSFKQVSLPLITWSTTHELGVRMMDTQHRQLAEHVNDLAASLMHAEDHAVIALKLATALSFTLHHFKSEESLMDKFGFKDAAAHRGAHARLIDDLQGFTTEWDILSLSLTARFLHDWLIFHIETADRDLARTLISQGVD